MGKLLSFPTSITIITILFMGGLTIMIIPINQTLTIQWNTITFTLWGIAFIWLAAMLWYGKQRLNLHVYECTISEDTKGNYILKMVILISSRHPDILKKIELGMVPQFTLPGCLNCDTPFPINNVYRRFEVTYSFVTSVLNNAKAQQNVQWDTVLWLEAVTKNYWITDGFIQSISTGISQPITYSNLEGSLNKNTHKKKERKLGITDKQFHKLIDKASKPLKKSEKEKS